jgi:hypothetical protein
VAGAVPVFTGVSVMFADPEAETPVTVPVMLEVHENVAPLIETVGTKLSAVPLQILLESEELVIVGVGFTVAMACIAVPTQLLADGVTV